MKKLGFFLGGLAVMGVILFLPALTMITALAGLFQAQANAAQATANLVGQCFTGFMVFVAIIAGTGIGYGVYASRIALSVRRERQSKWGVRSNTHLHKFPQRQNQKTLALPSSLPQEYFLRDQDAREDELVDFVLTHWR